MSGSVRTVSGGSAATSSSSAMRPILAHGRQNGAHGDGINSADRNARRLAALQRRARARAEPLETGGGAIPDIRTVPAGRIHAAVAGADRDAAQQLDGAGGAAAARRV